MAWRSIVPRYRAVKTINPTLKHPAETAGTLDHIVPRSQKGPDTDDNLQAAHHRCNSLKSDKVWKEGEQLLLIG